MNFPQLTINALKINSFLVKILNSMDGRAMMHLRRSLKPRQTKLSVKVDRSSTQGFKWVSTKWISLLLHFQLLMQLLHIESHNGKSINPQGLRNVLH
mmetsp:Transcript_2178/g.3142  ORF Transcript_2178/g.3142 Transcript_2178/m.3142 type:complete len:97 (+) Transcript_2178:1292-1582(+)